MLSQIKWKMMCVQSVAVIYTLGFKFLKWHVYGGISCAQACLNRDVHKWYKKLLLLMKNNTKMNQLNAPKQLTKNYLNRLSI